MTTGNQAMQLETGSGWTRGLRNMLRGEFGHWFGTRRWLSQILVWAAIVNGIVLAAAVQMPSDAAAEVLMIFNIFMGTATPVGVAILMMTAVVDEKRSGTAAWILSKPVSRSAFLLSKLAANTAGVLVSIVAAQGLIGYLTLSYVVGLDLSPLRFVVGLGAHAANLLFFLTLTLMLGAIFDHPGPVAAIAIGFNFVQQYLPGLLPFLEFLTPYNLGMPVEGGRVPSVATAWMTGVAPASVLPFYSALVASGLFVAVGLVVFQRQEL